MSQIHWSVPVTAVGTDGSEITGSEAGSSLVTFGLPKGTGVPEIASLSFVSQTHGCILSFQAAFPGRAWSV
jgi:hypothetical protein